MASVHKKSNWVKRFLRWLLGSPFRELPSEFGDPTPPELRVFEAEAAEVQHRVQEQESPPSSLRPEQTKPIRRDEFLERE